MRWDEKKNSYVTVFKKFRDQAVLAENVATHKRILCSVFIFESRPNSCVFGTAGLVMTITFINKWTLAPEKASLTRGKKVD